MGAIPLLRQGVLGATTLFSLIVMAISADLISQGDSYTSCALALAVAVLSLLTLPVMFVVDIIRLGAFTSMIAVELPWLSCLGILWVAAGGAMVSEPCLLYNFNLFSDYQIDWCPETQAIGAFSFLNFITILFYTSFLSVKVIIAASRGQSVWGLSVKQLFGASAGPVEHPMTHYNSVPPQSQIVHPQHTANVTQPANPGIMV